MYLKTIIFVLLIGVIASLLSGLVFLLKDSDKPKSRRTLHALGVRVTLAIALVSTIFYGGSTVLSMPSPDSLTEFFPHAGLHCGWAFLRFALLDLACPGC